MINVRTCESIINIAVQALDRCPNFVNREKVGKTGNRKRIQLIRKHNNQAKMPVGPPPIRRDKALGPLKERSVDELKRWECDRELQFDGWYEATVPMMGLIQET